MVSSQVRELSNIHSDTQYDVTFTQFSEGNSVSKQNFVCFSCQQLGHVKRFCLHLQNMLSNNSFLQKGRYRGRDRGYYSDQGGRKDNKRFPKTKIDNRQDKNNVHNSNFTVKANENVNSDNDSLNWAGSC